MNSASGLLSFEFDFDNVTATTPPSGEHYPKYIGFICCAVAVFFFGSNFVPTKKAKTGDGMFYQWVMGFAIWLGALVVYIARGCPPIYTLGLLSGVLWATGNLCVIPIIRTIGLGLGLMIWATFNTLFGWASGRFGWFGLQAEVPGNPSLNYIGVGLSMVAGVIFVFVKPDVSQEPVQHYLNDERSPLLVNDSLINSRTSSINVPTTTGHLHVTAPLPEPQVDIYDRLTGGSLTIQRVIGVFLAVVSGMIYGCTFAPCIYIQENYEGASKNGMDYVFIQATGIFATCSVYFLIYCFAKRSKPEVYPESILPSVASGIMWLVAQTGWFVANSVITEAISFPIISTGPMLIVALWSIFVFKEIKGTKNFIILGAAFCFVISGVLVTAFSGSS